MMELEAEAKGEEVWVEWVEGTGYLVYSLLLAYAKEFEVTMVTRYRAYLPAI